MPVEFLMDLSAIDLGSVLLDQEQIKKYLQQRYELLQVDAVIDYDRVNNTLVGLKKVRHDEIWVRGHIPGRPVMPGVLVIEAAAQIATIHVKLDRENIGEDITDKFFGFGGVNNVKFRQPVLPGNNLIILTRITRYRSRSFVVRAQGLIDGKAVFEGDSVGMII